MSRQNFKISKSQVEPDEISLLEKNYQFDVEDLSASSSESQFNIDLNRPFRPSSSSSNIRLINCLKLIHRSKIIKFLIALFLLLLILFLLNLPLNSQNFNPSVPLKWNQFVRSKNNWYHLNRNKIQIGSNHWKSLYPPSKPSGPPPRQEWIDRYKSLRLISSDTKPDSPLYYTWKNSRSSLSLQSGLAQYPEGTIFGSGLDGICSYRRASCLRSEDLDYGLGLQDIWLGKNQTWSINFDDGPLPPSQSLYKFLDQEKKLATHFWIGSNVRDYPELAIQAWKRGDHLAVHTWTHAHLTTLDDFEIMGELGWTIQIIYDLTGLIPLYYRPPYGDVDNRVRAIAKHVFGLKTLLWNCDSSDWSLNQTYAMGDFVDPPLGNDFGVQQSIKMVEAHSNEIQSSLQGGIGKIILEHELSEESVLVFKTSFENVKRNGWKTCNVAECLEIEWYQNQ
ncbi:hypothetical protein O181_016426 [Austropuccinia psidii MF-1]|uniref:chitin deacetylase n=1 Tax=Austropuccinia psidii MF-1 TaxID=1389203 RepID=A0A9Q3GR12_9BASI|nr:hypothetical protein [Austropuccinia psidii MF-1]